MMEGWTVYDHPRDYPDKFVARRWIAQQGEVVPTPCLFTANTLNQVRAMLPPGLVCFPRSADDDAKIVEVWM